jgi:hypothetical protein
VSRIKDAITAAVEVTDAGDRDDDVPYSDGITAVIRCTAT